jgi:hypothetical protein
MVYPLAQLSPETANWDSLTGFLTQKELDPDFVAFNSENRRYHFPHRTLVAVRGGFLQLDPLVQSAEPSSRRVLVRYALCASNPVLMVDPTGLQEECPICGICGPDITDVLKKLPSQIEDGFERTSEDNKKKACQGLNEGKWDTILWSQIWSNVLILQRKVGHDTT